MVLSRNSVRNTIIVSLTLVILNLRPAIVGQFFNTGFLLLAIIFLVTIYIFLNFSIFVSQSKLLLFMFCCLFLFYVVAQAIMLTPSNVTEAFQISLVILIVALAATLLLKADDTVTILKTITLVVIVLSLSQLVTYGYILLGGTPSKLLIGDVIPQDFQGYPWAIQLYFPFTITVHFESLFGVQFPRAAGIFREPGIYQMLIIFSFFSLDYLNFSYKNFFRLLLIFSLFTVTSTAGYAIFLCCLLYKQLVFLNRKKHFFIKVLAIMLLFTAVPFLWNLENVGLEYKLYEQGARTTQVELVYETLWQNPLFGIGIGAAEGRSINFLASLSSIGLVGALLYLLIVWCSVRFHYSRQTGTLILPIILTLLLAQPMFEKGFVIFLFFISTKSLAWSGSQAKQAHPNPLLPAPNMACSNRVSIPNQM
jgi:hypothetical protein